MENDKLDKTTVYLPEQVKMRLAAQAYQENRPQAQLIREAVESYLTTREARQLPSCAGTFQGAVDVPATESKEWARRRWRQKYSD